MKHRLYLCLALSALFLWSACSSESLYDNWTDAEAITFDASVWSVQTKGTPLRGSQLENMGVFGYRTGEGASNSWRNKRATAQPNLFKNLKITHQNGKWAAQQKVYWPKKLKENVSFFAYSPFIDGSNRNGLSLDFSRGGIPVFTYTVPSSCQDQPDLLVAPLKQDLTVEKNGGREIAFEMRHALTSIGFKGRDLQGRIARILVEKVATSGQLKLDDAGTPTWTLSNDRRHFEAVVSSDANRTELNTSDGYLMMIPQTLTPGAKLQAVLKNGAIISWNLSGQWLAGQCIYYDLDVAEQYSLTGFPFVGAFWKANQTGERIIRMPFRCSQGTFLKGTWKVWVDNWGGFNRGDIVLSADKTTDSGVTFQAGERPADMNDLNNDRRYSVSSAATEASGKITAADGVYFRIGLKSTCPGKVRYARLRVEYGIGDQKQQTYIYLRQGEDADYLMPYSYWAPDAKPITVYNLKAPYYYNGTHYLDKRGASFTAYPSQVGAYFQWNNDRVPRYAYSVSYSGGWSLDTSERPWSQLEKEHAVCPKGYRRPYDGYIDRNVLEYPFKLEEFVDVDDRLRDIRQISELKASLVQDWSNPTSNSLFGYYADGFFDRRQVSNNVVAATTDDIACCGRLYINNETLASLFLPASGYREGQRGQLNDMSRTARYWTGGALFSITGRDRMKRALCLDINTNHYHIPYRSAGANIRCVKDERSHDQRNSSKHYDDDDDDD